MKIRICLLALLFSLATGSAFGGWVFVENSEGDQVTRYIQDNKMKFVAPDHIMIFDLDKNTIRFANTGDKHYWMGTPDEFATQARKGMENMEREMDRQLASVPPGQRAAFRRSLGREMRKQGRKQQPRVTIRDGKRFARLAGHRAERYEILFNDLPRRELWIASDIRVGKTFDVDRLGKMMRIFHSGIGRHSDETLLWSPKITDLMGKGWPLRKIDYDEDGYPEKDEVIKIKEDRLPPSIFELPGNYRRMSVGAIFDK